MKRLAAALLPAIALAFAQPVLANDTAAAGQSQAAQDAAATQNPSANSVDPSAGNANAQDTRNQHPPTARMNRATPSEKGADSGTAAKHPPARAMERATPDLANPDAKTSQEDNTTSAPSAK